MYLLKDLCPEYIKKNSKYYLKLNENDSILFDSLWPHGLYSPCNSPGQNTGVGSCSLLRGLFPTQGLNPGQVSPIAGGFFISWATREAQEYWSG